MKLWTKIALIAVAVTAALGLVGVGTGLAMGANFRDLNEMGIYVTPHQKEVVNDAEDYVENVLEEYIEKDVEERVENNRHHNTVTAQSQHETESLHNDDLHSHSSSLQDINRLEIDVQNAEITIFAVEEADSIDYFSNIRNDISKRDGSTLKIADQGALNSKIELEIFIPIGVLKEIEIDAAAGTVTADKIAADAVSLEIDAASVRIDELIVKREAELQINVGEMIIGYYDGPRLDVECDMGSIKVVCEGNKNDYNYNLECGVGEIWINEEIYSGIGEDTRVNNGGERSIQAECGMGEILLEFPNSL